MGHDSDVCITFASALSFTLQFEERVDGPPVMEYSAGFSMVAMFTVS